MSLMTVEFMIYYSVTIISVIVALVALGRNKDIRKQRDEQANFKKAYFQISRSALHKGYALLQEKIELENQNRELRDEVCNLEELVAMLQTQLALADSLAKHTPENYPVTYEQHSR